MTFSYMTYKLLFFDFIEFFHTVFEFRKMHGACGD